MATTDLSSKSLGDILTESGIGIPDHTSPKGSIYVDKTSGKIYQNKDGLTKWVGLKGVAYANGFYQDNSTQTTISTSNTWVSVGNNLTEGLSVGFSANTDTIVVIDGYDGEYEIRADVSLERVAGTNNYEVGLSIDGANPLSGAYGGTSLDVSYPIQHVGFEKTISLSGGSTVELAVRNLTNNNNIIVKHAQLIINMVE